jgi:Zn-dependent protease with chaperone function
LDFFAQQELARRTSRWLVVWFVAAAAFTVASYGLAAAGFYALAAGYAGWPSPWMPAKGWAVVGGVVGGIILAVSAHRMWRLSEGGHAVAWLLGARYVDPDKCTPAERRLLNVVEEMAIASGISVPPVYLMQHEQALNAMVAGHSPNEAVIIATHGAVTKLSRDELQGIMGHEFSHILNGDMALNLRLVGLLAGLCWLAERGEALVWAAAWSTRGVPREEQGAGGFSALFGALLAFVGFPGTLAANAIRAAVSRQREFLADAASVQFTRNPDGIAGALDSILELRAHTVVLAAYVEGFAHMFFAPAVVHWWTFATHPPIAERIRRAHPRFEREGYRLTRHGRRREVAVLDGGGNVLKSVRSGELLASVGRPTARHVDFGARLLANLPQRLREALHRPDEAQQVMLALASEPSQGSELDSYVHGLARQHMLSLAELAVPAIKAQPQKARDAFLAELTARVEADRRVTLKEFVLLTFLRQRLREGAGQPIATRFRKVEEVAEDLRVVLSLAARAAGERAGEAFAKGAAVLAVGAREPLEPQALTAERIAASLERLRHLAPFAKPGVLKSCVEAAGADGVFRLAEAELVRMVAATLDCPMPPVLAAQDPRALGA